MIRIRAAWEYLRGTYWAVPSAMALTAVVLSVGMITLDESVTATLLNRFSWVYAGGPEGARAVLSTIAGSMITVAGVTFSITIVALTLASQQFGPRLLRNFLRDMGNQIVLGTFVSTFLYCLLVLRTVRGHDDSEFVPHLAVTLGVALAMLSLGVLIFFIHHVATSIQATRIIANVAADLEGAVSHLFPERLGQKRVDQRDNDVETAVPTAATGEEGTVCAATTGYVQAIDSEELMAMALKTKVTLRLEVRPGAFVRRGGLLMTMWADGDLPDFEEESFQSVVVVGAERAGTQDVEYFINQLVELAVRSLSPGINDPATALSCIDRLEQALCDLADRQLPSAFRYDAEGTLRVVACPVMFADLIDSAFGEIERYGQSSVSVTCRLLESIRAVASRVQREEDRRALVDHVMAIDGRSRFESFVESDRHLIAERYRAALGAIC